MISIRLQRRSTNLTIIQIYAPTTEADESIVEKFYMNLQQILDDIPKKDAIQIIGDWNAKVGEAGRSTGNRWKVWFKKAQRGWRKID